MALAKKCDICGVFYEHDVGSKRNAIAFVKMTSKGDPKYDNPMDACPTCMANIEECIAQCKKRPVAK